LIVFVQSLELTHLQSLLLQRREKAPRSSFCVLEITDEKEDQLKQKDEKEQKGQKGQ